MKKKLQKIKTIALRASMLAAAASAMQAHAAATPPDFSTLTSGIDFSTVVVGVLAVASTLITVYVAIKGAKIVIGMVRGA